MTNSTLTKKRSTPIKQVGWVVTIIVVFVAAIALSQWLSTSPQAVTIMERLGYLGVIGLGIVGGLNFVVPIPPATFSALYGAAGFALYGVILALALGTLIADMIGFWIGTKLRIALADSYPKITQYAKKVAAGSLYWLFFVVMMYAAFVPFPNEAILIPLALAGVRFYYLLLPLIIGNILHQTILLTGVDTLTQFLF